MFLELSEGFQWLRSSTDPKNILGPISVDLYSREHDLNPKNILEAIRLMRHCPDRSAAPEKCSWTQTETRGPAA